MEDLSTIKINIENYRAINKASLSIDGITVVAGENGSGKSTISKILYYVFKTSSNYDLLVGKALNLRLKDVIRFLEIAIREFGGDRNFRSEFSRDLRYLTDRLMHDIPSEETKFFTLLLLDKLRLSINLGKGSDVRVISSRLVYIAYDILKEPVEESNKFEIPFDKIKTKIENIYKEHFGLITSRSTILLKEEFNNVFHTDDLPKKLEVYEFDDLLLSLKKDHLSIPYTIENAIYIDTPMMLGQFITDNEYWNDLNDLLSNKTYVASNNEISNIISREIIKGDVSFEDDILSSQTFSFKANDGSVFNLLDCATGIKAFSILQMLLKLGKIDSTTLLIIDEPESNLHPQWIVEYARIIVLINKHIGAKFFIASHNPDLISAVRYISEKENVKTDFYLARGGNNSYEYESLGMNIDPIFQSFNIALTRIDQYGI